MAVDPRPSGSVTARPAWRRAAVRWRAGALRLVDAVRLVRADVVDVEYYQAQVGQGFPSRFAAARHYLASGRRGYSLHPLFEPAMVGTTPGDRRDPLLRYLADPGLQATQTPHPLFDLNAVHPADAIVDRPWLRWLAGAGADSQVPVPTGVPPITWGQFREAALAAAAAWREAPAETSSDWTAAAARPRQPGRVSILAVADGRRLETLLRWLTRAAGGDWELVFCGALTRAQSTCLALAGAPDSIARSATDTLTASVAAGALAATGEYLVVVGPGAPLDLPVIDELVAALADPAVAVAQPLNLHPDTTIRSAGAYLPPAGGVPAPLLAGHAAADAEALGVTRLPGALSAMVAVRAADFVALAGFAEAMAGFAEVDFSLRAAKAGRGHAVLVPQAQVTVRPVRAERAAVEAAAAALLARWPVPPAGSASFLASAGFTVVGHEQVPLVPGGDGSGGGIAVAVPRVVPVRVHSGPVPRLRWTIDTAATAGRWGDSWGDTHFANSLAEALRRLGQHVAVDRRTARGRASRLLDDVVLTLRGRDRVEPLAGPLNLLWVIAHPDDVTASEAAGYAAVFAASSVWAADRSREWGVEVRPLLQCTDPAVFHPMRADELSTTGVQVADTEFHPLRADRLGAGDGCASGLGGGPGLADGRSGSSVVFVGNARRGLDRPIISAALRAGAEVAIYGTGWETTEAAGRVVATQLPNADVGALYASAGLVLNDHWEDMRRHGFVSNRLFDAVACGARVLSDPVEGAEELFGGCVQFAGSAEEVARLLRDPDAAWPGVAERLAVAERIRAEHSFDHRARVLLDHVLAAL